MAGLLRTTSRSESSNFYFQHFQQSGDTLVEFFSKFESAIDKQRYLYAENNQLSEYVPIPATHLKIEKDAANIYTRQLYYLVREEIESAWYHSRIDSMTLVEGVKHFKVKDALLNGRLFKVTVRVSDHDVNCECKFYLRRGYLCRHAFACLHQCDVSKMPLAFVKTRWVKNAENHPSVLELSASAQHCVQLDEVKLQVKENWFNFQSCMSIAGFDKSAVSKIRTHVQAMKVDLKEFSTQNNESIDKFVGPKPHSDVVIQNPNTSRNKGCGSRIKSGKKKRWMLTMSIDKDESVVYATKLQDTTRGVVLKT